MPCSGVSHAWVFSADSAGSCGCGLRASAWHPPTQPPDRQRANCMLSARVSWPSHRPFVPPRQLQSPSSREPQPWWPVASQMWLQLQACPTCATQTLSTLAQLKGDFRFWITAAWWQHSRGLCDPAGMQGGLRQEGHQEPSQEMGPLGGQGPCPLSDQHRTSVSTSETGRRVWAPRGISPPLPACSHPCCTAGLP